MATKAKNPATKVKPKAKPKARRSRLRSMPDAEMKKFVLGYVDGSIWTSAHVRPADLLSMVFMPLALGALQDFSKADIENIGCIWASTTDDPTVPSRAINGYPMFLSCHIMTKKDWERAMAAINVEKQRREELKI